MSQNPGLAGSHQRKRKIGDATREIKGRPKKRIRKQSEYHSSSDESDSNSDGAFPPVNLLDSDEEEHVPGDKTRGEVLHKSSDESEDYGTSDEQESHESPSGEENGENVDHGFSLSNSKQRKVSTKRNDPEAFLTSMSKLLSTKLSRNARKDPLMSRNREALQTSNEVASERLEKRVRAKLRADRKEDLERGRVKDVLGLTTGDAGKTAEEEKRLRRIAQKGVVKLFNAVRAAQVKGEEAAREERKKATVGL